MNVGYRFESLNKDKITHSQIVRYAGASGDFNPVHTVVPFAENAGLGGVIAHGMLVMGFIGQAIGSWFSLEKLIKFSVRFQAMTYPGETLKVIGSIVGETEDCWLCEAYAMNEKEVKVKAEFEVKK